MFVKLLKFTIRGTLFLLQVALMLAVFFGIQIAFVYLTWFIHHELSPSLPEEEKSRAREVFTSLVLHTLFFIVIPWGLIPYYSIREDMYPSLRALISCSCGLLTETLTVIAIYVGSVSWGWSVLFDASGQVDLARHCRAISIFLGVIWVLGWCSFLVFLSVATELGVPPLIRRMLIDMRKFIAVCITASLSNCKTLLDEKNTMVENV